MLRKIFYTRMHGVHPQIQRFFDTWMRAIHMPGYTLQPYDFAGDYPALLDLLRAEDCAGLKFDGDEKALYLACEAASVQLSPCARRHQAVSCIANINGVAHAFFTSQVAVYRTLRSIVDKAFSGDVWIQGDGLDKQFIHAFFQKAHGQNTRVLSIRNTNEPIRPNSLLINISDDPVYGGKIPEGCIVWEKYCREPSELTQKQALLFAKKNITYVEKALFSVYDWAHALENIFSIRIEDWVLLMLYDISKKMLEAG